MKLTGNTAFTKSHTERGALDFRALDIHRSTREFKDTRSILYSTNRLINLLEQIVLVKNLGIVDRVNLKEDNYLYRPEEQINYLYFPESAVISEFQMLEDGKIIETALIGREGMTKPLSLTNYKPSTNWSQVTFAGTALRIKVQNLREVFDESKLFQKLIFKYLQDSVEQYSNRIICNTYHLLTERFCSWLLMVQDRINKSNLPLTHEKAARLLGAYRPNVSVVAKILLTKKIIKYERGHMTILDRGELENCACACYSQNKIVN